MKEGQPLLFILELTGECNSACRFCYNVWKDPKRSYPAKAPLTLEQREKVLQSLINDLRKKEIPISGVALAGGEPLLDSAINETIALLNSEGIPVNIATNGILLNKERITTFKELGVRQIEVSLPATQTKSYAALTHSTQISQVRNNILQLKELYPQVDLTIAITVTKETLSDIEECIDIAIAFSANSIALNRFVSGGEGLYHRETLQPSLEELTTVLTMANRKAEEYKRPINITIPVEDCLIPHELFPSLNFGTCSCAEAKWVIDPSGNLRMCEQNPHILGNLTTDSFLSLQTLPNVAQFKDQNRTAHCRHCHSYASCGGGCRFAQ